MYGTQVLQFQFSFFPKAYFCELMKPGVKANV